MEKQSSHNNYTFDQNQSVTSGHTPEPTQLVEVLLLVPACFTCVTADCSLESTEGGMAIAPPIRWEKLFLGWSHQIDAVGLRRLRNPGQESDSPIVLNKRCVEYAKSKQSVLFLNKKCKALNTPDLWFDVPCTTIVYSLMQKGGWNRSEAVWCCPSGAQPMLRILPQHVVRHSTSTWLQSLWMCFSCHLSVLCWAFLLRVGPSLTWKGEPCRDQVKLVERHLLATRSRLCVKIKIRYD